MSPSARRFPCPNLLILGALSLSACTTLASSHDPARVVAVPSDLSGLAWTTSGELVSSHDWQIGIMDPTSGAFELLDLAPDPACRLTRYLAPHNLPDGRLGVLKDCLSTSIGNPANPDRRYLMAYDWTTRDLTLLVPTPLMPLSAPPAWDPEMTQAIAFAGDPLVGAIYWVDALSGLSPVQATLSDGRRAWWMASNFKDHLSSDSDPGLPGDVAWSPDGSSILFWASLDAMGRHGLSRPSGSWDLYAANPASFRPHSILSGVRDPHDLQWSPDGKWISFYARLGPLFRRGIWLFSPQSRLIRLLTSRVDYLRGVAWSPDMETMALLSCLELYCERSELRFFELGTITD